MHRPNKKCHNRYRNSPSSTVSSASESSYSDAVGRSSEPVINLDQPLQGGGNAGGRSEAYMFPGITRLQGSLRVQLIVEEVLQQEAPMLQVHQAAMALKSMLIQ